MILGTILARGVGISFDGRAAYSPAGRWINSVAENFTAALQILKTSFSDFVLL